MSLLRTIDKSREPVDMIPNAVFVVLAIGLAAAALIELAVRKRQPLRAWVHDLVDRRESGETRADRWAALLIFAGTALGVLAGLGVNLFLKAQ
jgi:hypothetical protein